MGRSQTAANAAKHHLSFDDPFALVAPDPKHSTSTEERRWLIGEADAGLVVVVFTLRGSGAAYRLISARRANRKERTRYEEAKRLPF